MERMLFELLFQECSTGSQVRVDSARDRVSREEVELSVQQTRPVTRLGQDTSLNVGGDESVRVASEALPRASNMLEMHACTAVSTLKIGIAIFFSAERFSHARKILGNAQERSINHDLG
jgi:hypothetical protein